MADHPTPKDDPAQLQNAENVWENFMQGSKYSIIAIVIILIALLFLFVPMGS